MWKLNRNGQEKIWYEAELIEKIKAILKDNTCNPKECGMNQPDWNGEVYGCYAGQDGEDIKGCSCALANYLTTVIQEFER